MQGTAGVLGACLLTAAMLGNVFAQAPDKTPPAAKGTEEHPAAQIAEEIRQKLHDPITLELRDASISDALQQILTPHKIDFWFDDLKLKEEERSIEDLQVTCNLHNVSIRAALKRVLSQAQLSWVCEDAGVRITTRTDASTTLFHRIYDISDLLEEPEVEVVDPAAPQNAVSSEDKTEKLANAKSTHVPALTTQMGGGMGGMLSGGTGPISDEARAIAERKAKEASRPENVLMNMILGSTGGPPDCPWVEADGEGGSIHFIKTTQTKLLVIRQNEEAHADIEDLLNELLSHHHQFDEEGTPKTHTAATPPRSLVRIIVKRPAVLKRYTGK
jgi:hypothetical protein